jgi:hypothetical protein
MLARGYVCRLDLPPSFLGLRLIPSLLNVADLGSDTSLRPLARYAGYAVNPQLAAYSGHASELNLR